MCEVLQILNIYVHFVLSFEVIYLNACVWSVRPKNVAYIDVTDKIYVTGGRTYFSFENARSNQNECHTKVITGQFSVQLWRPSTEHISAIYIYDFSNT